LPEKVFSADIRKANIANDGFQLAGRYFVDRVTAALPPFDRDALQRQPLHKAFAHDLVVLNKADDPLVMQHWIVPHATTE
jgi:hypothetical protein